MQPLKDALRVLRPIAEAASAGRAAVATLGTLAMGLLLAACAGPVTPGEHDASPASAAITGDDLIVVAVADTPLPRPGAGSTPRADYRQGSQYAGSDRALADAASLARAHGLAEIKAWTIEPLRWRCMLYRLPAAATRSAVLARLEADPRVRLAQPLNRFDTLAAPASPVSSVLPVSPATYNDPYLPLQSGFAAIDAAGAQRVSRGERTTVAVIDTGIDASHPELRGRVAAVRDFVGRPPASQSASQSIGEHHGTQVAGVIAAAANNGIGIVGIAPAARLLSLRACWAEPGSAGARCNSFTLAEALTAAIAAGADVINLSLGGPRDPLLEALVLQAMARGAVIVGALPPGARRDGFPSALAGVLAVASSENGAPAAGVLAAPGQRILTLAPGGGYDFASGSSLASAHVSGAVALLRGIDRSLTAEALGGLLAGSGVQHGRLPQNGAIDACRAVQRLRATAVCSAGASQASAAATATASTAAAAAAARPAP